LKYLLLLLAIVVAYWLIRAHQRKRSRSGTSGRSGAAEDMVRCAHCGVHLPRSESLASGPVFYCTPEHLRLHQQDK
jgi:uncharacterized protein